MLSFVILCLALITVYCFFLNHRFHATNPAASTFAAKPLSDDELASLAYPSTKDMADWIRNTNPPTGRAYIVVGGSGLVGQCIIKSLLGRGETLVRNIDVVAPSPFGDPNEGVHVSRSEFVEANVTDYDAIKTAISKPFGDPSLNVTAQVVIHTAGAIRHWERLAYLKPLCHKINVGGTKNVLKAAQELGTVRAFVFTSSVTGFVTPGKYLRFWLQNPLVFGDEPIQEALLSNNHYPTSKREADALVRAADNIKGIRTGVLRPGMAIVGPGDQYITIVSNCCTSLLGYDLSWSEFIQRFAKTKDQIQFGAEIKPISGDELAKLTYPTAEDMGKAAGSPTGKAYVVVGGSGFVGRYIVRTLLGRGETLVRIIDVVPPDLSGDAGAKDHLSHADFVKADVTDYGSIKDAMTRPFGNTGITAQVVIHTVGVIRHWERLPYLKHLSQNVNIGGTKNVIKISQELETVGVFVFTSTAGVFLPPANYLRLTRNYGVVFNDDIPSGMPLSHAHYPETKREADALVRAADNIGGIRTGVLRPGMAITGPGDLWITFYLKNTRPNSVWSGEYFQNIINPWDLARAHIQLADALETRPDELGGSAFAITGQPTASSFDDLRKVTQACCRRNLGFQPVPALPLYILSHLTEAILATRFYVLDMLSGILGRKPSYIPQWAMAGGLAKLQPAMWDFAFADYIIDDSRVREVLGYQNLWSNEQTLKWTGSRCVNATAMLFVLLLGALSAYAYLLNKRLTTPHHAAHERTYEPITNEDLATLTYPTADDMANAAGSPTGKAYIVIGGSGLVGAYIVRTLLGRGETLVLIIDTTPPNLSGNSKARDHLSRAGFIKADITDYDSIKAAISRSFGGTGVTAQVIIHSAEIFRPYERLPYLRGLSYSVNVDGTKNVLRAAQELGTVRAFVFTSKDAPQGMPLLHSHYANSKREADALVRAADNVKGMRTGVLRPGMSVLGVGDVWSTSYLKNPDPNFVWGGQCFQNIINPWDLARAHVQFADALEAQPNEFGGSGFAVTGQPTACSADELRRIMQACCHRDLQFQPVSVLPLYVLSHFMEMFFMIRFYMLSILLAVNLQPALWDFVCADYVIDDRQIRKALGYRNFWSNEQTIKWIVENFEGNTK
ncbi:3-beta hydroxysteroid dehydrogenase/isomerase family protein [Ceratobasidium sp. AG-Ba]|nr:3-beta hydroxysteroid dehydrogenase/isomerase family protein [Ceratobasidium sp. AG-Ba]